MVVSSPQSSRLPEPNGRFLGSDEDYREEDDVSVHFDAMDLDEPQPRPGLPVLALLSLIAPSALLRPPAKLPGFTAALLVERGGEEQPVTKLEMTRLVGRRTRAGIDTLYCVGFVSEISPIKSRQSRQ